MSEHQATALLLLTVGALLLASALASRATRATGLPIPLLFLGVGMLAGSFGLGDIPFEGYRVSLRLGTAALALILFDGGLNTPLSLLRQWYKPAVTLASVGVIITAGLTALCARTLGLSWTHAWLVGAIVSSTDAAAVFAALRASRLQLKKRVGATLELESGFNDPMAVILTSTVTTIASGSAISVPRIALEVVLQIVLGAGLGLAVGYGGRFLLRRARLSVAGLYPVASVGLALVAFALPSILYGSGFLGVYLAAVVLGNDKLPYHTGLLRVHDAAAWFSQVAMFLLLGLLVSPLRLLEASGPAIGIAVALAFLARPAAVFACLLPFRYPLRDISYVAWVGLRGAVPIILATFPVLAGVPGAEPLFVIVFFVVVVNAIVPGATVGWITRRLGLESSAPPPPAAVLEITSTEPLRGELMAFAVSPASAVCGSAVADLPFPPEASALLLVREDLLIAPKGQTVFQPGDHVYVFCGPEDRPLVQLLFGRREDD